MTLQTYSSFRQWHRAGRQASYVRSMKSPGGILDLLEVARPAGDMSRPAQPDLVLHQDLLGGSRIRGDSGGGYFDVESKKGDFGLDAPNFAHSMMMDTNHRLRSLSFSMAQWQSVCEEAADCGVSLENFRLYRGSFRSPAIQSVLRNLWALSEEEGAPSRLLARAAGCENSCRTVSVKWCAVRASKRRPRSMGRAALPGTDACASFRRHQPRRIGSRGAALILSLRAHVQAKPRRAATRVPNATENGESLRTS